MRALEQARQGRDPLRYLAGAQVSSLTPALGDEIDGVDLTKLDSDSKDQLALHVARRGVLVFRNQEPFINKDKDWFKNWGTYFGR
jgi:sulfonate dioxygenase